MTNNPHPTSLEEAIGVYQSWENFTSSTQKSSVPIFIPSKSVLNLSTIASKKPSLADILEAHKIFLKFSNPSLIPKNPLACFYAGLSFFHGFFKHDRLRGLGLIKRAAELNLNIAQYSLFLVFRDGIEGEIPQKPQIAFEWGLKAAKNGNVGAQLNIGHFFYHVFNDSKSAFHWYSIAAENSCPESHFILSSFYHSGIIPVEKDEKKSYKHCFAAARFGHPSGCFLIGQHYEDGHVVKKNMSKALKWYSRGATKGSLESLSRLGLLVLGGVVIPKRDSTLLSRFLDPQDPLPVGLQFLQYCCNRNHLPSQYALANYYSDKGNSLFDISKAIFWATKVANSQTSLSEKSKLINSDPILNAQVLLGAIYSQFHNINPVLDGKEKGYYQSLAVKWYGKAATAGFSIGQFNLGLCFQNGVGVPKSIPTAFHWFKLAADNPYDPIPDAQLFVGKYYSSGIGRLSP